jgi:hypothetical protein
MQSFKLGLSWCEQAWPFFFYRWGSTGAITAHAPELIGRGLRVMLTYFVFPLAYFFRISSLLSHFRPIFTLEKLWF